MEADHEYYASLVKADRDYPADYECGKNFCIGLRSLLSDSAKLKRMRRHRPSILISYNALMKLGNIFMSSAASVLQSVVGFVLVMCANAIVRKYEILPEQYSGVTD